MFIGKYTSYAAGNTCRKPDSKSRFWRYTASAHGRQVTGYGISCEGAKADWKRLTDRGPGTGATHGGLSTNSVLKARGTLAPAGSGSNTPASGGTSVGSVTKAQGGTIGGSSNKLSTSRSSGGIGAGASGGGQAGAGIGAAARAGVELLPQAVQDAIAPITDVYGDIGDKIEDAGLPSWLLPAGIVGLGLVLVIVIFKK